MSLVGDSVAFVSIGASCQTAEQINRHSGLLSDIIGEELSPQSSFFDWLFCDVASIPRFIRDYASKPLVESDIELDGWRYGFVNYGLWMWHEEPDETPIPDVVSKYNYLLDRFRSLSAKRDRFFVFSNTQNNLDFHTVPGRRDFTLTPDVQNEILRELTRIFPDGENKIIWVSNADRITPEVRDIQSMEIFSDSWEGRQDDWRAMFERNPALLERSRSYSTDLHVRAG